jgi:transposase
MRVQWSDDFKQLYKERGQQKYGIRLLALWKIQEGLSETKVCSLIGKTHKSIRRWRKSYEEGGLEALLNIRDGRGRKARLVNKSSFEQDMNALETRQKGGRIRCQDIVDYIAQKHNLTYSRSGMYHILHRFGFSWITSRSKHPKQNQEEQEAFKKTS